MPPASRPRRRLTAAATVVVATVSAVVGLTASSVPAVHATAWNRPLVGHDISWPNCPKGMGIPSRRSRGEPMPPTTTGFVILGLTNGPAFTPNPCIDRQVAFVKTNHLRAGQYAMTTFPNAAQRRTYGSSGPFRGTDRLTRIRNAGYAEAKYNVATAKRVGLTGRFIWVDVEDYPVAPWTANPQLNRAAIQGVLRGYADAGYRTGIYSIVGMWTRLTGSWRPKLPLWDSVGDAGERAALRRCSASSFTGGRRLITQWWTKPVDHDVTCPGVTGTSSPHTTGLVPRLFVRY